MEKSVDKQFWGRHTFLVVTGASQGIGRNLAIEFSRLLGPESTVLLLARSFLNLEETKKRILEVNCNVDVKIESVDLSKPDVELFTGLLAPNLVSAKYELYVLVHNAANIICDVPAAKTDNFNVWNDYMSLNLYSVAILTSAFLKLCDEGKCCIVNISSLAAVKPFKGLSFYCIGKASREMYFKVLAEENPSLNVLSYCPGPIETDMYKEIANKCCDPEVKESFMELMNNKNLVKMEDTVAKLIFILREKCYQSGDRIDFYDDVDNSTGITSPK